MKVDLVKTGAKLKTMEVYWSIEGQIAWIQNQGLNCIDIDVWWQIRDLIEEIQNQGSNWKRRVNKVTEIDQNRGQIEEIESLLIN